MTTLTGAVSFMAFVPFKGSPTKRAPLGNWAYA